MLRLKLIFCLSVAGLISACGPFESANSSKLSPEGLLGATPFGTCDRMSVPTFNVCMSAIGSEYNDPGYLQILESSCESTNGTFSASSCVRTNSFGTCVIAYGQTNETHITYYPPTYDEASAQAACASNAGAIFVPVE